MTVFRSKNAFRKLRHARASTLGPASYATGSKPTLTFSTLRGINAVEDVQLRAEGYDVVVTAVAGNVVTFKVMDKPAHTHTFVGSALGTHQHDIVTVGAAGGGNLLTQPTGATRLESAGAGQTNTNAIAAKTGGTPAGSSSAQTKAAASEVIDGTVLNGVTFYGEALGW